MEDETIYINEVQEIMRTPNEEGRAVKFDITVRTLNKNSKTGGKLNTYENAKLVMKEKPLDPLAHLKFKPSEKKKVKKNPQHFPNKTRNIRLESGEIKKIHYNYIITFNGKKVIY